jgi:hypothetical protein
MTFQNAFVATSGTLLQTPSQGDTKAASLFAVI